MTSPSPNRRDFLHATAAGVAAATVTGAAEAQQPASQRVNAGGIPLRPLGKTGEMADSACSAWAGTPAPIPRSSPRRRACA